MRVRIPAEFQRFLRPLIEQADKSGRTFHVVGGCVRDWLLERPTKDLDLVMEDDRALAFFMKSCVRRWGGKPEVFKQFGTIRLHAGTGLRVDFVRARVEEYPEPAALPVVRLGTLVGDLYRRDFSINAMAAAPGADGWADLVDPYGGCADMKRRTLRVLHDASFRDDPTRMFRAARFACRFGFRLDPATERLRRKAMEDGVVERLSRERLRGELIRILEEREPSPVLRRLRMWGLARHLHPEFAWPKNIEAGNGPMERLGMMALAMGEHGVDFIRSLNLERPVSQALLEACDIWRRQTAPRSPLPQLALDALGAFMPGSAGGKRSRRAVTHRPIGASRRQGAEFRSPAAARRTSGARAAAAAGLKPLLIDGEDLKEAGLSSGPDFKTLLESAARAQWTGEFSTRAQGLLWLHRNLGLKRAR